LKYYFNFYDVSCYFLVTKPLLRYEKNPNFSYNFSSDESLLDEF